MILFILLLFILLLFILLLFILLYKNRTINFDYDYCFSKEIYIYGKHFHFIVNLAFKYKQIGLFVYPEDFFQKGLIGRNFNSYSDMKNSLKEQFPNEYEK